MKFRRNLRSNLKTIKTKPEKNLIDWGQTLLERIKE